MVHFILGVHCHQPVGNFDFVFENAHNNSYFPFLQILSEYPQIKCVLHYSGILFDWIKIHKPQTFELIKSLVQTNQLELMSGGFYEPILTTIPPEDQMGQIQMLNQYIEKEFKSIPAGLWLTERIWEPHLPKILYSSGIKYITVDDNHLKQSGIPSEELFNYFITEELAYPINVFPISEKLRYLIPFKDPEETIQYLKEINEQKDNQIIVLADDGEKFGDWPGTYDWVYNKGWLKKFFQLLIDNSHWLNLTTFSDVLNIHPPKGKVYMATSSYEEMMGWALPTSTALKYKIEKRVFETHPSVMQFYRGGFWRNFLSKYQESNRMYSKMQLISQKINAMNDSEKKAEVLKELWQGQCNCAYWHGEFGGLYLSHLRTAIYKHLIIAEQLSDQVLKTQFPSIVQRDYDSDGFDEILCSNNEINVYFSKIGGQIIELDIIERAFNITDTFTRQEEPYHLTLIESQKKHNNNSSSSNGIDSIHDIQKKHDKDILKHLIYDPYPKHSLIDHFFVKNIDIDSFRSYNYQELGDFVQGIYQSDITTSNGNHEIILTRRGVIDNLGSNCTIELKKVITIKNSQLDISYQLKNLSDLNIDCKLGIEYNFSVLAGDAEDRYYFSDKEIDDKRARSYGLLQNIKTIGLRDDYQKLSIQLDFNENLNVFRLPVETVSQSVDSYELIYQSSCILPLWDIHLNPNENKIIRFNLKISTHF